MTKFFFAILLTETKSRSIKTQKTKIRTTFSHLDRTILVNKRFILWPKRELLLAGPTQEIPSGQDEPILPVWIANQNVGFASSRSLAYLAIQQK